MSDPGAPPPAPADWPTPQPTPLDTPPPSRSYQDELSATAQRPEVQIGAAFAGGFLFAMILKRFA
jgi:hypothetical protein